MIFTLCIFFFYLRMKMEKKTYVNFGNFNIKDLREEEEKIIVIFFFFYHDSFSEYICKNIHQN